MNESRDPSHDPLKSLFEEAAAAGRARASYASAGEISSRGRRVHRRRLAVLAVGACLLVGGGGAALASLLPGPSQPVGPATSPSTSGPAPADTTTTPPADTTTGPPATTDASSSATLPPLSTPTSTSATTAPPNTP
ncbi:hypothetical protein [Streptomyces globisporus]|uniref:hypothetical protein n=1 Tax=Streptomyces globisporus TaxID=1908 RepID=UPI000560A784|nr:hypothetical protein [Streptomyces globisporus]